MNRRALTLASLLCLGLLAWRRRTNRLSLANAVVVITGGSRGLGLQIARGAARRGAKLAILARSHVELDAARRELEPHGTTVLALQCDVRRDGDIATAFERIANELGAVDVLVTCAGMIGVGPVDALVMSDYTDAMETNYLGAVRAVEAVRGGMQRRRAGRIVAIASIGGMVAVPHLLPYCASKFALRGYAEGLRVELARDGIKVTTVCPGLMRTGSPPHGVFAGRPDVEYALFAPLDALLFTSISAEQAARKILDATERGDAEIVLSIQARALAAVHAIAPRATMALLGTANRFLPRANGRREHRTGVQSTGLLDRTPLRTIGARESVAQHENLIAPVIESP
ncbi:MAG: SDR family oxidoreductase [Vulcanimicrobiaceae bacterium]